MRGRGPRVACRGAPMPRQSLMTTAAPVSLLRALAATQAPAQSAGSNDAEIAALKQQLRLMEQKIEKLQRQSTVNAQAAARANEKVDTVANANAAIPTKAKAPPSAVVAPLPNNRPTICTADNANCVAITSRVHFDVGGYDYRPNSAAT